jgi:transcriptional regulator with XRE-family HTH domain
VVDRDSRLEERLVAFGARVRGLRRDLGLSQEALADRAGLHRTYIGSVERGERNVSLSNLYALADVLGTSVASWWKGTTCSHPRFDDTGPRDATATVPGGSSCVAGCARASGGYWRASTSELSAERPSYGLKGWCRTWSC